MPHDTLVEKPVMLKLLFTRKASRRGFRINGTEAPVSSSCTTKLRGKPNVLQKHARGSACTRLGRHWAACFRVKRKSKSLFVAIQHCRSKCHFYAASNATSSRVLPQNCTTPQTCSGDRFPYIISQKSSCMHGCSRNNRVLRCKHVMPSESWDIFFKTLHRTQFSFKKKMFRFVLKTVQERKKIRSL